MASEGGLTFRVTGFAKLRRHLSAAQKVFAPAGMRDIFGDIAIILERSIDRNFDRERAPGYVAPLGKASSGRGRRWKPLAKSTIAARRRGSSRILQDRGQAGLRGSISSRHTSRYAVAGTNLQYGLYQHGGTGPYEIRPKTKRLLAFKTERGLVLTRLVHHPGLTPRPFIGYNDADVDDMISAVTLKLRKALPGD